MISILTELVVLSILIFGILIIGLVSERQFQLPRGTGPSLVFLFTQLIFAFFTLNPAMNAFGLKSLATLTIFLLFVTTCRFCYLMKRKFDFQTIMLPMLTSSCLYLFWRPGERSWDGAGYHNLISLLVRQEGTIWGWPNLMWAQWFPANQEIFSGAISTITNSYSSFFVPNIMWFAATNFFILRNIPTKFRGKKSALISVMATLSIPVLVFQTGTSYVDFQTTVCTLILATVLIPKRNEKSLLFAIFLASAGLTSSKWSGIVFLPFLVLISLVFNSEFVKLDNVKKLFSAFFGGIVGLAPVCIRNYFEFQSPTFPFKGPFGIWPGLFEQSLMTDQIGYANMPTALQSSNYPVALSYQYLFSPFQYWILSLNKVSNYVFHSTPIGSAHDKDLMNYIGYDARLGGFGAVTTLAFFAVLFSVRKNSRNLSVCFLIFLPIVLLPMGWWPRYYLGFVFVFLYIYREDLITFTTKYKLISRSFFLFISFSAILNVSTALAFGHTQKSSWTSNTGYGQGISAVLPSSCEKILVVGEGLTFSSGLWGEKMCNQVIGSLHFGNEQESLGQFGSVDMSNDLDISAEIKRYVSLSKSLVLIFTNDELDGQLWYEKAMSSLEKESDIISSVKSAEVNNHPFHMLLVQNE